MIFSTLQLGQCLVGVASEEMQHARFYAFAKQFMGEAPRTYACIIDAVLVYDLEKWQCLPQ